MVAPPDGVYYYRLQIKAVKPTRLVEILRGTKP